MKHDLIWISLISCVSGDIFLVFEYIVPNLSFLALKLRTDYFRDEINMLTVRLIENMNWSVWIFTVIECLIANKPITSRYLRLNTAYGNKEIYLLEQLSFPKLLFIYLIIHRHFRPVSFYVVNEAYSDIPKH